MIRSIGFTRPFLALGVWILCVGGLGFYMSARPNRRAQPPTAPSPTLDDYWLELVLTFEAGPDPFALAENNELPSLEVQLAGEPIYTETSPIAAGEVISISELPNLLVGPNDFFVSATPLQQDSEAVRALRIRLWQSDRLIAEESIWSEPGGPVTGALHCLIPDPVEAE